MIPGPAVRRKAHGTGCRSCGEQGLVAVLDLGPMPHADGFLSTQQLSLTEPKWPLEVAFCPHCTLLQVLESPAPKHLFGDDFQYYSGVIPGFVAHVTQQAQRLIAEHQLSAGHLVLEVGSNDGTLLRAFQAAGVGVLGVDPAPGPVAAARAAGVPTRQQFFGLEVARQLAAEGLQADLVLGNNVLAHTPDPNDFVAGIATLLKADGLAQFEVPYLGDLVAIHAFDTIYHEHHCYFSVSALRHLFARHGLNVMDVEPIAVHGGSIRVSVGRGEAGARVGDYLVDERRRGLTDSHFYADFATECAERLSSLRRCLLALQAEGARIAAYGAAAKGTVLLNAGGFATGLIEFVVDRNPHKQGRYVPGVRLPIDHPDRLLGERVDYALVLAWNWADEILAEQTAFAASGGRFVIPLPELRIV